MKRLHLMWAALVLGSTIPMRGLASSPLPPTTPQHFSHPTTSSLLRPHIAPFRVSADPSGTVPTVQTEDWTTKDIKLPWNQVAVDKSFGQSELVVFTKSFKFKVGWISNRKERIHARWTTSNVEIFVMRGRDCGLLLGCESGTNYALPKRIKIAVGQQDYFLKSIEQNTYALTPEFKQAVSQTANRLMFKIDERVNFEIQEEALPGLKNLFASQPVPSTAIAPSEPVPATVAPSEPVPTTVSPVPSTPVPSQTLSSPPPQPPQPSEPAPVGNPVNPAPANTPLF
jgi:hypothetical protein